MEKEIECHPFEPFIPDGAKILMLGTFPPQEQRWSMEFFYPNWINDMWRIMGNVFYGNPMYFADADEKKFKLPIIVEFLNRAHIALYDTAVKVRRLNDNASDKYLEIVQPVDLHGLLQANTTIQSVVTTGEKAASVVAELTHSKLPKMGEHVEFECLGRVLNHFRMPSSSRAYPMSLAKKSEYYATMFALNGIRL